MQGEKTAYLSLSQSKSVDNNSLLPKYKNKLGQKTGNKNTAANQTQYEQSPIKCNQNIFSDEDINSQNKDMGLLGEISEVAYKLKLEENQISKYVIELTNDIIDEVC